MRLLCLLSRQPLWESCGPGSASPKCQVRFFADKLGLIYMKAHAEQRFLLQHTRTFTANVRCSSLLFFFVFFLRLCARASPSTAAKKKIP